MLKIVEMLDQSIIKVKLEKIDIKVLYCYHKEFDSVNTDIDIDKLSDSLNEALILLKCRNEDKEIVKRVVLNIISYLMLLKLKNHDTDITKNTLFILLKEKFITTIDSFEDEKSYYRNLMYSYFVWEDNNNRHKDLLNIISRAKDEISTLEKKGISYQIYKQKRLNQLEELVKLKNMQE